MSWCLPCASLCHSLSSKMKKHTACLTKVSNSSTVKSKGLLCIVKKCSMLVISASCVCACSERRISGLGSSVQIASKYMCNIGTGVVCKVKYVLCMLWHMSTHLPYMQ